MKVISKKLLNMHLKKLRNVNQRDVNIKMILTADF